MGKIYKGWELMKAITDGVTDLLEALKKKGKKIYLLSNAQRIFTEYEMHTLGIAKYFDDIFISSTGWH